MKLRKSIKLICVALFLAAFVALVSTREKAVAFSTGPDPGRTGAPGELTCATGECHGSSINSGPGQFSILAPAQYLPGETYQITVRHQTNDATRRRWGFQITALTGSNARAGNWQGQSNQIQIVEDTLPDFRRQYAQHTDQGTFPGQSGGASWTVNWKAPATDIGPVTFYAAGNQADNNNNNSGDQIYRTSISITAGQTPPPPAQAPLSGSLLFFNLYTSSVVAANSQNTRISLTNTDEERSVAARLFFVDGLDGSIVIEAVTLKPHQTLAFLASDVDPGATGYLIAVAVDTAGCPINFNSLIGDEYVKLSSGHAASLNAEAFPMLPGSAQACSSGAATLKFDDAQYAAAARALTLSTIASRAEGNETLIALNRLGGDLRTNAALLSEITGALYDDAASAIGFTVAPTRAQFISLLSNNFPRTATRFEDVIPAGRSGWLKVWQTGDAAMLGAAINFNPKRNTSSFNHGHNLRRLTLTRSATLTIPIVPLSNYSGFQLTEKK